MTLTRRQQYLIVVLTAVMILDMLISINGAWNSNTTFYEANPIFASLGTVEMFVAGLVIAKVVALGAIIWIVSLLNEEPGTLWGDMAMMGGTFSFVTIFITLAGLNILIAGG